MSTIEYLEKFQPVLHKATWINDGLRWIGWQIIRMLANLADGLTSMYGQAFKLIDFGTQKMSVALLPRINPSFGFFVRLGLPGSVS